MSVQNGERLATKQDLADMYQGILPYLGGIVTSKAGFTPIGTIISVMGTTAPVNYLACDGTVYNIADYVELANYFNEQFGSKNYFGGDGTTTFAVPDLRGEFLRGTGTNSHTNQGSGANVGVHQNATEIPYFSLTKEGQIYTYNYDTNTDTNMRSVDKAVLKGTGSGKYINASMTSPSGGASTKANMSSVRPTNTSVLYCIATKNFYIDPTLDYSTDEKVVGTWIDGKTLYQKTIEISSVTRKSWNSTAHGISSIDKVVKYEGFLLKSNGAIQSVGANSSETIMGFANRTNVELWLDLDLSSAQGAIVTIQYTKTN